DLMKDLKLEFLKRNLWLPIRREGNSIVVLIDNPQDLQRVDAIYQLLRGQNVLLAVGFRKDIALFLANAGGEIQSKDSIGNIITALGEEAAPEKLEEYGADVVDENDSAVIRLANQIIIDVFMRILAASEPIPVDKLGMLERNLREVKTAADKPYGLILCVGPTGSGKTTTLHSVLGYINKPERKIWTAEDPVEITQYGLRQVQVNPKIGFTFAQAMRSFLRADPDVIMVGEMRDEETASVAIEASLTGHLVLSTLHTNSSVETVVRLLDMGLDPFNFADALLGILAQRLVKRLCSECKTEYHPVRAEFDELAEAYGKDAFAQLGCKYDEAFALYKSKGCAACTKSGYRGRAAIHELLVGSDEMKRPIQTKAR